MRRIPKYRGTRRALQLNLTAQERIDSSATGLPTVFGSISRTGVAFVSLAFVNPGSFFSTNRGCAAVHSPGASCSLGAEREVFAPGAFDPPMAEERHCKKRHRESPSEACEAKDILDSVVHGNLQREGAECQS